MSPIKSFKALRNELIQRTIEKLDNRVDRPRLKRVRAKKLAAQLVDRALVTVVMRQVNLSTCFDEL
jgi:hypothetical protein